jgi:DNA mismatch repair ATPase MutS
MSFMLEDRADEEVDVQSVQMLYSLTEGKADRSFGLNVGTMAGIPACIIRRAQQKSLELEEKTIRSKQMKTFLKLINRNSGDSN